MKNLFLIIIVMLNLLYVQADELISSDNVIAPKASKISFLGQQKEAGGYLFQGKIKIRGLLEAGWRQRDLDNKGLITHELELHFYPEKSQVALLPSLRADTYQKTDSRLIVLDNSSKEAESIVKKYFHNIPEHFFKYEEGILKQPAIVILDNYKTYVECDNRYYSATLVSLEKVDNIKNDLVKSDGCMINFEPDIYLVHSKDGYANLRKSPNSSSSVIMKLTNDTILEKIKTDHNWFCIKLYNNENHIEGYIHNSQVRGQD